MTHEDSLLKRTHIYNTSFTSLTFTPLMIQQMRDITHLIDTIRRKLDLCIEEEKRILKLRKIFENLIEGFLQVISQITQQKYLNQPILDQIQGDDHGNLNGVNLVFMEKFSQYLSTQFLKKFVQIFKKSIDYSSIYKNVQAINYIKQNQLELQTMIKTIELLSKFEVHSKFQYDFSDIIAKPLIYWKKIDSLIEYKNIFKNQKIYANQMHSFLHMISITNGVAYMTNGQEEGMYKNLNQLMYTIYFKLFRNQSFLTTKKFLAEDNLKAQEETAISTWNGMDRVLTMRLWVQGTFPGIKYHQKIYVPKCYEQLTLEKVLEWSQNGTINQKEQLKSRQNISNVDIYQKTNKLDKVKIRILSNTPLIEKQPKKCEGGLLGQFKSFIFGKNTQSNNQSVKDHETIILHIHGGGWVSMSSFSHQMYTRRWAKNENLKDIPIFSVDYRRSPGCPYPGALEDCWQAYLFIVNRIKEFYNVNPKKIILAGDSAGGNMVLGITQLCIKYNVQKPHGILLAYPAVNLSTKCYTPSMNSTLTDLIVPFAFLELCMNKYMQDSRCNPDQDTLLSPILMSKEVLSQLPPVRIICGEDDCLKDDGIRFLNSLIESGHNNSKMTIYKGLKHGFLNWDIPLAMPITRQCIHDTGDLMAELKSL